jgi:hypothetical protein
VHVAFLRLSADTSREKAEDGSADISIALLCLSGRSNTVYCIQGTDNYSSYCT